MVVTSFGDRREMKWVGSTLFVEALVAMGGFVVAGRQQLRMWIILGPPFEPHECAPLATKLPSSVEQMVV